MQSRTTIIRIGVFALAVAPALGAGKPVQSAVSQVETSSELMSQSPPRTTSRAKGGGGPRAGTVSRQEPADSSAEAIVGTTPDEWQVERWLNSPPLTLASLRGKVVLVRWWTAECSYCSTSAPALREFDRTYGPRGLVVIGLYHHKGGGPFDPRVYERTAKSYGFAFPLAVDTDWRTLNSWTRDVRGDDVETGFTSLTFVLDKKGVVRHVHPGGQYVEGDDAHTKLRAIVERLLAED